MTVLLAWALLLALFPLAARLGRRLRLAPIVSQLLLAALGIPALVALFGPPLAVERQDLLTPGWLRPLYDLAFALLLGHILADVAQLRPQAASLRLALPSFLLPFACGLATAVWLLGETEATRSVALGLLFAMTAIPVLFLYLSQPGFPAERRQLLMQAAIAMDLACWSLFAAVHGAKEPLALLWPLAAALAPLALKALGAGPRLSGGVFFGLLLGLQWLHRDVLVFGIAFLALAALLRLPLASPFEAVRPQAWLFGLGVPLILAYGFLQVDPSRLALADQGGTLALLILLPLLSKLAGNWLGLAWAERRLHHGRWQETLLLNTRGLTEIVFLNLLFGQGLIAESAYVALMFMGLLATLLPGLWPASARKEASYGHH